MGQPVLAILSAVADGEFVARLATDLRAHGYAVEDIANGHYYDEPEAEPSQLRWRLEATVAVLVVVSPAAVASEQWRAEVEYTRLLAMEAPLLPLVIAPVDLPASLRAAPAIAFEDVPYAEALSRLLDALERLESGRDALAGSEAGAEPDVAAPYGEDEDAEEAEWSDPFSSYGGELSPGADAAAAPEASEWESPPGAAPGMEQGTRAPISGSSGGWQRAPATGTGGEGRGAPSPSTRPPGALGYAASDVWSADEPAPAPPSPGAWGMPAPVTAPAPRAPAPAVAAESVAFATYAPREIAPRRWERMLVYIAVDSPPALALVHADAAERLAGRREAFRAAVAPTTTLLRRGTPLTLLPAAPGLRFNPPSLAVTWEEDAQCHELQLLAESAVPGQAVNGVVQVFTGPYLRAEIPFSTFVRPTGAVARGPDDFASAIARAYRRIFASYSRRDSGIVRACEEFARATGDAYLRDMTLLRSGERFDERLEHAITEADIFQLFWSRESASSPAVGREWRHALALLPARPGFIRPVYWSRTPYLPLPTELAWLEFAHIEPRDLGLRRSLLARLFGG